MVMPATRAQLSSSRSGRLGMGFSTSCVMRRQLGFDAGRKTPRAFEDGSRRADGNLQGYNKKEVAKVAEVCPVTSARQLPAAITARASSGFFTPFSSACL